MSPFRQALERARTDRAFRKRLLRNPLRALASYALRADECGVLYTLAMEIAAARTRAAA